MRMYLTTEFDRPVDKNKHYLSPGGYEAVINEKAFGFDFNESSGTIDKENPAVVHWKLRDLDTESFPESEILEKHADEISAITECFVYTGEDDEPEIYLKKVLSMAFDIDGRLIEIPTEILDAIHIS